VRAGPPEMMSGSMNWPSGRVKVQLSFELSRLNALQLSVVVTDND
jgi:hypothetical protein